jgi:hypothetical protein
MKPLWQTDFDPYDALIELADEISDLKTAVYEDANIDQRTVNEQVIYKRTANLDRRLMQCERNIHEINNNLQWLAQYLGKR